MKNFALIGIAGFAAPKHLKAIKQTDQRLVAAMDINDSVGILDHYFPQAHFFTGIEQFEEYFNQSRKDGGNIDFLTVCTPNHLHNDHIKFGLKQAVSVICEKPLVLNPQDIEDLVKLQEETGKQVFNLLQLRLHPDIIKLKEKAKEMDAGKTEIDLTYITPRGNWYHNSWKGDINKSGGIATNIGIHFFDMLIWIFGSVKNNIIHIHTPERAAGFLELERAKVRWFLSINETDLPAGHQNYSYRTVSVEGKDIEFSSGFTDLHTKSYEAILEGNGFSLQEALPSIELVHTIRNAAPVGLKGDFHPLAFQKN